MGNELVNLITIFENLNILLILHMFTLQNLKGKKNSNR